MAGEIDPRPVPVEEQARQTLGNVEQALPARAVVPVPALHFGFKIEIEAVALAGSS